MTRDDQARLLAAALYEIRILLAGRIGAGDGSPETEAAAIAYALHNDALAIIAGQTFDADASFRRLASVDARLQTNATVRLRAHLGSPPA